MVHCRLRVSDDQRKFMMPGSAGNSMEMGVLPKSTSIGKSNILV